jgi:hypothetical protein
VQGVDCVTLYKTLLSAELVTALLAFASLFAASSFEKAAHIGHGIQ